MQKNTHISADTHISSKEELFLKCIVKEIEEFTELPYEFQKGYYKNATEVVNILYKQIFGRDMPKILELNLNEEMKNIFIHQAKKSNKNNKQLNGDDFTKAFILTFDTTKKEPNNQLEILVSAFIPYTQYKKHFNEDGTPFRKSLTKYKEGVNKCFTFFTEQMDITKKTIMESMNELKTAEEEKKKLQKQQELEQKKLQKQQELEQKELQKQQAELQKQKNQERKQRKKAALQKQKELEEEEQKKKAALQKQQEPEEEEQKKKVQKDKKAKKKKDRKQKQQEEEKRQLQELEQKEFSNLKDLLRQIPIQNSQIPQNLFEKQEELNRLKEWLTQRYKIAEFNSQDVIEGKIPSDDEQNQQENDQTQQSKQVILHTDIEKVLLQQEGQKQPESSNFESNPQLQTTNKNIYEKYDKQQYKTHSKDNTQQCNARNNNSRRKKFTFVPKKNESWQQQ